MVAPTKDEINKPVGATGSCERIATMQNNKKVDLNFGPSLSEFADIVVKVLIESGAQTGEYRGIGGHGLEDHCGHGLHSQISIGLGNRTINIRKLQS